VPYGNLIFALLTDGRVDSAAAVLRVIRAKFPSPAGIGGMPMLIALARDSIESAAVSYRTAAASARDPQLRARWTDAAALVALERGRLAEARRLRADARATELQRGAASSPLDEALEDAMIEAWFEERPAQAVKRLDSAITHVPMRTLTVEQRSEFSIASAYAIAGRPDRARAMIAQFDAAVKDTTIRRSMEPQRHWALSEIAIAEGRAADAVIEIRKADSLPDGPADDCARCTYAALARAFDLAGMPDSAIVTFERYLATPYWRPIDPRADPTHLAGTYKRLGELYEAKGNRQRAASYYAKFIELWKNADPELQPKVAEVRKRLARLSDTER
jgi:tetratricopeptide (TPR) repeat protein